MVVCVCVCMRVCVCVRACVYVFEALLCACEGNLSSWKGCTSRRWLSLCTLASISDSYADMGGGGGG